MGEKWRAILGAPHTPESQLLWADVRARHPRFLQAVLADARVTASYRGDRCEFVSRLDAAVQAVRLAVMSDAFLALCCYRAKAALQARRIPVVPRLFHRLAIMFGQVAIGDPAVLEPGVYIAHGQVVIDGITTIRRGVVIGPFVTIGLVAGDLQGPTIDRHAYIGTGSKILGPVLIGRNAKIGANSVVLTDVPNDATAVGSPARVR
jgi:serine O-acetyltransferase